MLWLDRSFKFELFGYGVEIGSLQWASISEFLNVYSYYQRVGEILRQHSSNSKKCLAPTSPLDPSFSELIPSVERGCSG